MAQPLDERFPPFVLQLFSSNGSFTSKNVTNRWKHTETELAKYGIKIAGISSDGDPRLLSAMCHHLLFNSESDINVVQDSIHIATKFRNRILNVNDLPMGTHKVSVEHLKKLLNVDKAIHGLNRTDVSPDDRQNFDSFEKITSKRTLDALKTHVSDSAATVKYLQLCSDVVTSYRDLNLKPLERIELIWRAVYFFRIWREFIIASKTYTLKDKFITSNTFSCIELNARSLVKLVRRCRQENKPQHFLTTLFQSQTCEKTFRQLRSMGSVNFTKINFSVLELLYMVGRIEALNEILHFKLFDKGVVFPKFEVDKTKTKIFDMPSDIEIAQVLNSAKNHSMEEAKKFGMSLDESILGNYEFPYKRRIGIDVDNEQSQLNLDDCDDCEYLCSESDLNGEINDDISNIEMMFSETSTNQKRQFTEVLCENGSLKIIRKSSLVWLLTEKGSKLSNDRLKRVQATVEKPPYSMRTRKDSII